MNLSLSTGAKEAIKTALAFALAYAIALKVSWMNPSWAGFAVAMVSIAAAGQSLHKGSLRIAGTIPGCAMALIILSLASQSRWGFVMLTSLWIFFTTYLMIVDKQRSYMWNVAGFVCLVILVSGPSSSEAAFEHAMYRTLETIMGVVVYTLVSVFIWPRNNAGAITKASVGLVGTQGRLIHMSRQIITGGAVKGEYEKLHAQEIQQLGQLTQALQAEGSESYQVRELRPLWNRFHQLSAALMMSIDRLGTGSVQISQIDLNKVWPDLPVFFDEIYHRIEQIQRAVGGGSVSYKTGSQAVSFDAAAWQDLNSLDRAAMVIAGKELKQVETLTGLLLECAQDLTADFAGSKKAGPVPVQAAKQPRFRLPVFDLDHLKGAAFAAFTVLAGFLVWILVNPPGHAGWFEFPAIVAMAIAATQQINVLAIGKSISLASLLCLGVYVFIMPGLSTFAELGSLLFVLVFINCYFFTGVARLAGLIAIINEISVQNQQSYDFAAMANSLVFIVIAFIFLFLLTYLLNSSRPEKALLKLMSRYFRSMGYLVSRHGRLSLSKASWFDQWKDDFHLYEIKTLPEKIAGWGKAIDPGLFPANSQQRVLALVTSLQVLSIRVEVLFEAGDNARRHDLFRLTETEIRPWLAKIESAFDTWAVRPEAGSGPADDLQARLSEALKLLEERIGSALGQADTDSGNVADGEGFYRLLGGLQGVSEASVAYAGVAGEIDWEQWREERFS